MDTHASNDPASKQRVATNKALSAAGYGQHERVIKDEYTGRFVLDTNVIISCCPSIKATNDIRWDGQDPAVRSRNQEMKILKIQ